MEFPGRSRILSYAGSPKVCDDAVWSIVIGMAAVPASIFAPVGLPVAVMAIGMGIGALGDINRPSLALTGRVPAIAGIAFGTAAAVSCFTGWLPIFLWHMMVPSRV